MQTYEIVETLTYYVVADSAKEALEMANEMDKADAKRHNIEAELA